MTEQYENIRVYRTTLVDVHHTFVEKRTNGSDERSYDSVRSLALGTHWSVECLHRDGSQHVSIDFVPFHNIDCLLGFTPRLHTPLTALEQAEFWKHFLEI